jgi:hypothetical protein
LTGNCDRQTLHVDNQGKCNHLIHAIVTLFLFGFWLPVWIIAAMSASRPSLNPRVAIPMTLPVSSRTGDPLEPGEIVLRRERNAEMIPSETVALTLRDYRLLIHADLLQHSVKIPTSDGERPW